MSGGLKMYVHVAWCVCVYVCSQDGWFLLRWSFSCASASLPFDLHAVVMQTFVFVRRQMSN